MTVYYKLTTKQPRNDSYSVISEKDLIDWGMEKMGKRGESVESYAGIKLVPEDEKTGLPILNMSQEEEDNWEGDWTYEREPTDEEISDAVWEEMTDEYDIEEYEQGDEFKIGYYKN